MNWKHLKAMLWMRWRILVNRIRKTGKLGNVLLALVLGIGALLSLSLFFVALVVGFETLPGAKPIDILMAWVLLSVAFLFFWLIGLLMDLQRSDSMSFENLMHLPVSVGWVFLYNYFASFVSFSVAFFLPAMLGLSLAMVIVFGPWMLLCFPLVFGYFGMITAVTYQLRGWLSRLMEDKRRGRNIVVLLTFGFVMLFQAPNLINLAMTRNRIDEAFEAPELVAEDPERDPAPVQTAEQVLQQRKAAAAEDEAKWDRGMSMGAMAVPLGWLSYGVRATFVGRWPVGLLCAAGMFLVSGWSLRSSFRRTLASFLGANKSGDAVTLTPKRSKPEEGGLRKPLLVLRKLPFVSDAESGIAFASMRSIIRAPETKLLLLGPALMLCGSAALLLSRDESFGASKPGSFDFSALMSLGATAMGFLSIAQLMQNQFGLDRDGLRSYLLSPVPRHSILRAKNLGLAPFGLAIGFVALLGLTFFVGLDAFHFLGALLQMISSLLIFCIIGNLTSVLIPMRLKPQGMKAAGPGFLAIVASFLSVLLIPVALSPLLAPWLLELLMNQMKWAGGGAVYLLGHVVMAALIAWIYNVVIVKQGALFQNREQTILEIMTRE